MKEKVKERIEINEEILNTLRWANDIVILAEYREKINTDICNRSSER